MKYLAIDVSGKHMTVAVDNGKKVFCKYQKDAGVQHSVILNESIENTLKKAQIELDDLDFIACVVGAGSFTGIRIGVSTAKALAFAKNKPVVKITSFDCMAYNKEKGKTLCIIDAGHNGFYVCGYTDKKEDLSPRYVLKEELEKYKDYTFVSGEKIDGLKTEIVSIKDGLILAVKEKEKTATYNYDELTPLYVRKSQAEEGRK